MKRACDSFTPSKWAKWKCAACFFSDKDHSEAARGSEAAGPTTRRKPTLRDATITPSPIPQNISRTLASSAPSINPSPTHTPRTRKESIGSLATSVDVESHNLKPSALKVNPKILGSRSEQESGISPRSDTSDNDKPEDDRLEEGNAIGRPHSPFRSNSKRDSPISKAMSRPRLNAVVKPEVLDDPGQNPASPQIPLWRQKLLKKAKELRIPLPGERTEEDISEEAPSTPKSSSSGGTVSLIASQEASAPGLTIEIPKPDNPDETEIGFGTPPQASPVSAPSGIFSAFSVPILAHQPPAAIEAARVPTSEEEQLQRELEARYALLAEDKKTSQEEERARRVEEAKKRVLARKQKEQQEKDKSSDGLAMSSSPLSPRDDKSKEKELELELQRQQEREAKQQLERKLEEERQRELDRQRKEEEERQHELDRQRKEEEERLMVLMMQEEELNRKEAERKAREEEEQRKREEALKAKKEAEELREKLEEERAQKEVEREAKEKLRMEKLEKAKQKQNLRESAKQEMEQKRKDEEDERKKHLQQQKAEADRKRKEREEKKRIEEEETRKREEEERKKRQEEERKVEEEERRRQEEERALIEAQRKRREEEEQRRKEELRRREEEETLRLEQLRIKEEQDRLAKIEEERKLKAKEDQEAAKAPAVQSDKDLPLRTPSHELTRRTTTSQVKDWNNEFQELEAVEDDDLYKFTALAALVKDFCSVAEAYGKVIISERFLPVKTITPTMSDGVHYVAHGINFKLYVDEVIGEDADGEPIYKFGGHEPDHESAMKAAHSALQAHSALYHCRVPGLCYPMVTLIHYRGYSVLASAALPINSSTLIYGVDGSVTKSDPSVHSALKTAAKRLNLAERIGPKGRRYIGPSTLQVHRGMDGRNYVIGYDFLMPREAARYLILIESKEKNEQNDNPRHSSRLRPRLVAQSSDPLVSDALDSSVIGPNSTKENAAVEDITTSIYEDVVPRVAGIISTGRLTSSQIITQMHHHGLSLRHLGFIRAALPTGGEGAKVRQIILTECVARAVKNRVRHELRESLRVYKTTSEEPYRRTVFQAFKPVLSYQTPAPAYFEEVEGTTIPVKIDIENSIITRGPGKEDQLSSVEANFSLPIPWRQKSFFFEAKVESDQFTFIAGLCGTAPHNVLKDVTGYCISSDGTLFIQGKSYPSPFKIQKGDTIGIFYNWRGKEILFTINDRIGYSVGVAKGSYIPKIDIGANTKLSYTFGPNFTFDTDSLCEQLSIESCIIEDDSAVFWQRELKIALENYFPHCLNETELHAHVNLREFVDLSLLAERIEMLSGIFLSARVHEYLREDPVSPFTLAPYDILRLEGTLNTMDIADFSQGVVQLIDVMQRGFKLEKETTSLLQAAHQKLEAVYLHSPVTTPKHYFYYAQYYHHASLVYMLDPSATTLRYQRTALLIYNEALQSHSQETEDRSDSDPSDDADSQKRVHWQILLNKGILLCEMEAEEEAVSLFYQIRGESDDGDGLLMNQLEAYKSQLIKVNSQEHAMRIASLAMAISRAIVDPCHADSCILAAQVILAGVRYLFMAQSVESWEEKFNDYLAQIKILFDAIHKEDDGVISSFLDEIFSHPLDHNVLSILIKVCSVSDWLIPLFSKALSRKDIAVIHPSVLLRRMVIEHINLWSVPTAQRLTHLTSAVVETRSVNQWKRVKPQSIAPPPLYGASLTAVDKKLYLYGGNDGNSRRKELWLFDIGSNKWEVIDTSGDIPEARQDHSAVLIDSTNLLIWGGRCEAGFLNDSYLYNLKTSTWTKLWISGTVPSPRSGFSAVRVGQNEVWILGGKVQGSSLGFNEVFVLNLKSMVFESRETWGQVPVPDYNFSASCADGEVIFKFGGEVGGNDLYALHTSSLRWYFVNTGGKYPSYDNAQDSLSYITIRDKLVMFGLPKDVFALHLGVIPKGNPLYSQNFDPMGSELAHANWHECDSSDFPTEERKYFAGCAVSSVLYTHGGQDPDGRALDAFFAYRLETNSWERLDSDIESDEPLPELYGHSMSFYDNKLFIFGGLSGGLSIGEAATANTLYSLDLVTNSWTKCDVKHSGGKLIARSFHSAIVEDNLLYLVGGLSEESQAQVDVINLDSMTAETITPSGDIPRHRNNVGTAVVGHRLFVLGGLHVDDNKHHPLDSVDILDLSTCSWTTKPIRGEAPAPCEGLNLTAHGKYLLKYGGQNNTGTSGQLSILNTDTLVWEAEIDVQMEPMPGHFSFIMEDKLFVIEQGFEMAFLDIDAGDRLGLFRQLHTYGKRHLGKRAAVAVVGETLAYIYGGRTTQGVSQQFSVVDLEVDCFREDEKGLSQLPAFAALNRHIMVLAYEAKDLAVRDNDEVTDAYACAADPEWQFDKQRSQVVKASLLPHFNHEFYFYNVESRQDPKILIEVRDAKDQALYGAAAVQLKVALKMCSKAKAPLYYEKWFKLSDPNNEAKVPVSGEIRMKIVGF